jgi:hypothetical protein
MLSQVDHRRFGGASVYHLLRHGERFAVSAQIDNRCSLSTDFACFGMTQFVKRRERTRRKSPYPGDDLDGIS